MKFLIVDDDPAILKITSKFLELEGHEVVCCDSALVALKKLKDPSFDIVITDATMPVHSGFDLIRSIRKKKKLHRLTVAMLTGRSERSDIEQALELGVQDYIVKPIHPDVFMAKVANLVGRHQSQTKKTSPMVKSYFEAQMSIPISVTRITDVGVSVETPCHIEPGTMVQIDVKEFSQAGIKNNQFKVLFSKFNNKPKSYQAELLLLDLNNKQKKQLESIAQGWVLKKVS